MIKRTLYFGNPAYLSFRLKQLVVESLTDGEGTLPLPDGRKRVKTVPIEDIGIVILDNSQLTITSGAIEALVENNVAIVSCDSRSMPSALMLTLDGNTVQSERYYDQINASLPLKKQLWQQTVECKIRNQAAVLYHSTGSEARNMIVWSNSVRSGDADNLEGRAAAFYWKNVFKQFPRFTRGREGEFPNNFLNYGYAILRAVVARSLVANGMLPTLGIHHHNRYNAYCLADDIMEPYRPYVDRYVVDLVDSGPVCMDLSKDIKAKLLRIPTLDVEIDGHTSPLMVAVSATTASLFKCFRGECRKILYPMM